MDIFGILTMVGGLALFLYGMNVMGDGLAKLSGGTLERVLEKLTSRRIMAVLLGAGVTAVIQSSSATTVMVVGFVNSGIMQLSQAVGIIMGANVGTTITSWLLALTGIEGSSIWVNLLKPSSFSPVLAAVGIILIMASKDSRKKDIGNILLGFAVLMFGMETMSGAVAPLADNEQFTGILTMFSNPILGLIAGLILTAVIQSSSASVGILQALCATGAVSYGTAFPIIMGQNIGTCITAIMSSMGASKNAKRASMIHLYFNLIGTVIFMTVFYIIHAFVDFAFLQEAANGAGIAVIHTIFNITTAIIMFPFGDKLVKLAELTIRDKAEGEALSETVSGEFALLDERFLENSGFAMQMCRKVAVQMATEAQEALFMAIGLLTEYDAKKAELVCQMEERVDRYEDALGSYLLKVSSRDLSANDSRSLSLLLHCIGDFERISDHALNIVDSANEMQEKKLVFSGKAVEELRVFSSAVQEIVATSFDVFSANDLERARYIEPLEQVIDHLNLDIKQRHVKRLRKGKCTIELGLILQDICTNFERIADHCSNIGVAMLEVSEDEFETHEYINVLKQENQEWYQNRYQELRLLYALPGKSSDKDEEEGAQAEQTAPEGKEDASLKEPKNRKQKKGKHEKKGKK